MEPDPATRTNRVSDEHAMNVGRLVDLKAYSTPPVRPEARLYSEMLKSGAAGRYL